METPLTKEAGLPKLRWHGLRHTYVTHALAANGPMKIVLERLGNWTMMLTADTYTLVLPEVHAEAAELIARLLLAWEQSALADVNRWTDLRRRRTQPTMESRSQLE